MTVRAIKHMGSMQSGPAGPHLRSMSDYLVSHQASHRGNGYEAMISHVSTDRVGW